MTSPGCGSAPVFAALGGSRVAGVFAFGRGGTGEGGGRSAE